jgi:DNA-binding beta-propeller fold protein YncE
MIRQTFSSLLLSVTLLTSSPALHGKADTVRVMIAGGGLTSPIQITETKILESSHAWGGEFLDASRPPLAEAPKLASPYEVTLYSRIADNDIRKTCVFFYSLGSSGAAGVIYLPDKGQIWTLNSGTIIREGRDGKWSYASPTWEALVKPLIANAERGPALAAAPTSQIVVNQWTKPLPGWLYVLDPRSDPASPNSRVWLVDPESSKVMGSVSVGYDPDYALSPDGSRLYVASGERESGQLAIIDTATGNLRQIPFPDRVLYKPWYRGLPPFSEMATTSDGRTLWLPEPHVFSPDKIETRLSAFDTQGERFLKTTVDTGTCDFGDFLATPFENQLDFLCGSFGGSPRNRFVRLDPGRGEVSSAVADLPLPSRCGLAEIFTLSGGSTRAIVRSDGAVYEMDTTTQKYSPTSVTGACRERAVAHAEWPRSADGTKLYLGYGGVAPNGMSAATELRVFDVATWTRSKSVRTSAPFWSAAASPDGKSIYAVSPELHGIMVIDADALQENRVIFVGNTPSLAIVAPNLVP